LYISAAKEGTDLPKPKPIEELLAIADMYIKSTGGNSAAAPEGSTPPPDMPGPAMAPEQPT